MATVVESIKVQTRTPDALSGTTRAHGLDRWIFVAMAVWFLAITLAGFIPGSMKQIAAVQAGERLGFSYATHLHAVLMGSFLCLLLMQSWLVASGRQAHHARLGMAGFVLACLVVAGGVLLVATRYHQLWDALQVAPPDVHAKLQNLLGRAEKIMARQIAIGIEFTLLMAIAYRARGTDPSLHKRLIFLATAIPLSAATGRIPWLLSTREANTFTADIYTLATIAPLFIWDVVRNRRIHNAYWIWLAVFVPGEVAVNPLRDTPWWHAAARQIMGV